MSPFRRPVTAALAASLALAPVAPALAAPAVDVRVGTAKGFSRIELHGAQPVSARREGSDVVLRFGRIEAPDIGRLRADPPKYLKTAALAEAGGALELRLTLDEGAEARIGKDEGATYVNLAPAPAPTPAPAAPAPPKETAKPARANPVPAGGVVHMRAELQSRTLSLRFPWKSPLGAAVFRRGEAIWLVFDAKAKLDLAEAPRGLPQMRRMDAVAGADFTAVRIVAPPTVVPAITAEGGTWTLTLGPEAAAAPAPITLARDASAGPTSLTAQVAGATGVLWIDDPVVGDRFAAVTALGPAKGLPGGRTLVDAALMSSVQGLAVQPISDDLQVATEGDLVRIGRPKGLALSPVSSQARQEAAPTAQSASLPQPTSLPALIDFAGWSKTGPGGFLPRYNALMAAAADESGRGKGGGVQARLGLARFLVGSELAPEAIGLLNAIGKAEPTMLSDPEFRGLRGAARAMMGRYKEAQADFSAPVVQDDPASSLWRGYIATKLGDYTGAREQFAAGRSALNQFAPKWRSRFARADSDASLAAHDLGGARSALLMAEADGLEPNEQAAVRLAEARFADAAGQVDQALALYDQAAKASYGGIAAPALLRATEIRLDKGKIAAADAVSALDSLRYRWRGDETELETVRALGRIYLGQGRYREALDVMRSAGSRLADSPAAVGLHQDLTSTFKTLFLEGGADGLQPVEALALFYDFKEFTPIGADGDLMVRKLARRLVDVDLLDQAAELLKYQADNRLDGVPRAAVSTDLAMIQLMNRKPEAALNAINSSRTTLLPATMTAERRFLEARAWMQLGQYDHAVEILGKDAGPDAADIRGEVAWRQHAWPDAGKALEARLGDRWKSLLPLTGEEETSLLRAGAAYSLAGDDASLARLRARYGKLAESARAPEAIRVALSGTGGGALSTADFGRAISDVDSFAGWVQRMKQRFRERPAPLGKPTAQAQAAPAKPAPAPKKG